MTIGKNFRRGRSSVLLTLLNERSIRSFASAYVWFFLVALAVAVIVGIVALAIFAPAWVVGATTNLTRLSFKEQSDAIASARQSVLILLGGAIAIAGLFYTHRRHQLEQDSNRTDRFTKAIEQLGSKSLDVRLGGIFALKRIAEDSRRDRPAVVGSLAAFVREHTKRELSAKRSVTDLGQTDANAALAIIGSISLSTDQAPPDLRKSAVFSADLRHGDLRHANLAEASFAECSFRRANLSGVRASNSAFLASDLFGALCAGADFSGSDLSDVSFVRANLSDTNLRNAILVNVDFSRADLSGADLSNADMTGANISNVIGAKLSEAQFAQAYVVVD